MRACALPHLLILSCSLLGTHLYGQGPTGVHAKPQDRVRGSIDDFQTVTRTGNVHPLASSGMQGLVAPGMRMNRMILSLQPDANQQLQLSQLIQQQQDSKSPLYHHYLTSKDFGAQFGVSDNDIAKITSWLTSHGFTVEDIPAGRQSIVFSGTAQQVRAAFRTQIHSYRVNGAVHHANTTDPQIPAALAGVVRGVTKLHDFQHKPMLVKAKALGAGATLQPQFTTGTSHYLSPADFATIYDINPLYSAGINGTGQSVAVVARSNISAADFASFRTTFGLPSQNLSVIIANGTDPGIVANGDDVEATLDAEWAGAVAPNAAVKLVVAASTYTTDGVDLASQYIVNHNVAPVMSVSFGSCEAYMGSTEMAFYNSLWQQAAAQGITVFVSSGDSGAAGCNSGGATTGTMRGVNGLCSSPYSVCVGGTQFQEGSNPGQYWLPGNNPVMGSAISYIPEVVWNESSANGGSGLWAGGGGASIVYSKPSWQVAPGVPADGKRDVPDVSLTASGYDGYLIAYGGSFWSVGGTSASSPSFAGVMTLVNQKMASRQGNANPNFYALATKQTNGGTAVFHDITSGTNSVPGVTGFSAAPGYDQGAGLGSVDSAQLVNHWADGSVSPSLGLNASPSAMTLQLGQSGTTTVTATVGGGFYSAVSLAVTGAPSGVTASFATNPIPAPGGGTAVLTVSVGSNTAPGTYSLTITATGGTLSSTAAVTLVVPTPSFTLAASTTSLSIRAGASGSTSLTITPQNGWNASISLSASGLPAGVTASFAPATLASGTSQLTLSAASSATPGTYSITVAATAGAVRNTASLRLEIPAPASFTIAAGNPALSIFVGGSGSVTISTTSRNGFTGTVSFVVTGLPSGVTASVPSVQVSSTSTASSTLSFSVAKTASPGSFTVTVTGSSGALKSSTTVTLTVPVPGFSVAVRAASLTIARGGNASASVAVTAQNGFSSAVALSATGLPSGATASFAPSTVAMSSPTSTLTVSVAKTVAPGTYGLVITGTNGQLRATTSVTLIIPTPTFNFAATTNSVTISQSLPGSLSVTVSPENGFNATVTFSLTGLPKGVSAGFAPAAVTASAASSSKLAVTASSAAPAGKYSPVLVASGGGVTKSLSLQLTINVPASCTMTATPASVTVVAGQQTQAQVSCAAVKGTFSSALSFAVSGTPSGWSVSLSSNAVAAGAANAIKIYAPATAGAGKYNLTVSASTSTGFKSSVTIPVTLTIPAGMYVGPAQNTLTVVRNTSKQITVALKHTGSFNSAVNLSVSGLPAGIKASFSPASIPAPGDGNTTLTITAASSAGLGTSKLVLGVTARSGQTFNIPFALTVNSK